MLRILLGCAAPCSRAGSRARLLSSVAPAVASEARRSSSDRSTDSVASAVATASLLHSSIADGDLPSALFAVGQLSAAGDSLTEHELAALLHTAVLKRRDASMGMAVLQTAAAAGVSRAPLLFAGTVALACLTGKPDAAVKAVLMALRDCGSVPAADAGTSPSNSNRSGQGQVPLLEVLQAAGHLAPVLALRHAEGAKQLWSVVSACCDAVACCSAAVPPGDATTDKEQVVAASIGALQHVVYHSMSHLLKVGKPQHAIRHFDALCRTLGTPFTSAVAAPLPSAASLPPATAPDGGAAATANTAGSACEADEVDVERRHERDAASPQLTPFAAATAAPSTAASAAAVCRIARPSRDVFNQALRAWVHAHQLRMVDGPTAAARVTQLVSVMTLSDGRIAGAGEPLAPSGGAAAPGDDEDADAGEDAAAGGTSVGTSSCAPDAVTFNLYLQLLCASGFMQEAMRVPSLMAAAGTVPDDATFATLQRGLLRSGRGGEAEELVRIMRAAGQTPGRMVVATRLQPACAAGRMREALRVLQTVADGARVPITPAIANMLMAGFVAAGRPDAALHLFARMRAAAAGAAGGERAGAGARGRVGGAESNFSISSPDELARLDSGWEAASASPDAAADDGGMVVEACLSAMDWPPAEASTYRQLGSALVRAGRFGDAVDLLARLHPEMDVVTYSVLVRAVVAAGAGHLGLLPHRGPRSSPGPLLRSAGLFEGISAGASVGPRWAIRENVATPQFRASTAFDVCPDESAWVDAGDTAAASAATATPAIPRATAGASVDAAAPPASAAAPPSAGPAAAAAKSAPLPARAGRPASQREVAEALMSVLRLTAARRVSQRHLRRSEAERDLDLVVITTATRALLRSLTPRE
jgi:pentatricopeptide repeat protein